MPDIFTKHGISSDPIIMLAPMEGVTNAIFRDLICQLGGVDFVATEFVRITGERQRLTPFHHPPHDETRLQIQLMACDANTLRNCISFLKSRGQLQDNDWLDLNVGCPSKKVNARGAGAALLKEPEKLLEIIAAMRSVHPGPLSIKTRPAFSSLDEYPPLLSALQEAPLDFITIHARPKVCGHSGPVHFEALKEAVQALPYPVIGNGEIWCPEDAFHMIERTGVRGVMCGRGAIRDPLLLTDIASLAHRPPLNRKTELAQFVRTLAERYTLYSEGSKKNYIGTFKEFAGWVSKNPLVGREYFEHIKRSSSLKEIVVLTDDFFKLPDTPELTLS
jgi:tRNA-dihydrouridine synthase